MVETNIYEEYFRSILFFRIFNFTQNVIGKKRHKNVSIAVLAILRRNPVVVLLGFNVDDGGEFRHDVAVARCAYKWARKAPAALRLITSSSSVERN